MKAIVWHFGAVELWDVESVQHAHELEDAGSFSLVCVLDNRARIVAHVAKLHELQEWLDTTIALAREPIVIEQRPGGAKVTRPHIAEAHRNVRHYRLIRRRINRWLKGDFRWV